MTDRSGKCKGLVILDLTYLTLPLAVLRARRGWTVRYLNTRVRRQWALRLLERSGVIVLRLEEEATLVFGELSYNGPSCSAARVVSAPGIQPLFTRVAGALTGRDNAAGGVRAALQNEMTSNAQDLFAAEVWVRSSHFEHSVIVVQRHWDKILLKDIGMRARIVRVPAMAGGLKLVKVIPLGTLTRHLTRSKTSVRTEGPTARDVHAPQPPRQVMFVFNISFIYGLLYTYAHLNSPNPASPLHPSRAVTMSRNGGDLGDGRKADPFPGSQAGPAQVLRTLRKTAVWWTTGWRHPRFLWWCARFSVRVEDASRQLRQRYPEAILAVLAFEMQVPPHLAVSMQTAGIRTASLQERPAIAFDQSATTNVDTMLTASEFISLQVQRSGTMAVDNTIPTGMWRTDLLHEARRHAPPPSVRSAHENGQRVVLVLPYHAQTNALRATDPICTSIDSVRHFLDDIVDLAREQRDAHFIIRGKNADWVDDARFRETLKRLNATPNVEVNRDYATFNVSYGLAAHCDLIVAKPTSLADEALALGIPCLLHDYTHNSSDYARKQLPYLPRELWVLDKEELRHKVRDQIADGGRAFRGRWEPQRAIVYGDLNDGHVRERAQASLEEMLRTGSLA